MKYLATKSKYYLTWASVVAQRVKNLPAMQDMWVQSLDREDPFLGEGSGNPLQYSYLENSMDRVAWQATVHGVAKHSTRLNNEHTQGAKEGYSLGLTGDTPHPQTSSPKFLN